jgi:hypothetical protein
MSEKRIILSDMLEPDEDQGAVVIIRVGKQVSETGVGASVGESLPQPANATEKRGRKKKKAK